MQWENSLTVVSRHLSVNYTEDSRKSTPFQRVVFPLGLEHVVV